MSNTNALGKLTIVSTPIGNLGDMSPRAVDALQQADRILCEDTRHSAKLLQYFDIRRPTSSYHDHSDEQTRNKYLEQLENGAHLALISDAGTPLISDPGFKLVQAARDAGHHISAIPGACAPIMALSISGLPTNRFLFEGFLPTKAGQRKNTLIQLSDIPSTLIFFENGPRLAASLSTMAEVLGDRDAAVTRELTKTYEEVRHGSLQELSAYYHTAGPPKGEIVIVVAPPTVCSTDISATEVQTAIQAGLADGAHVKDLASVLAKKFNLPKKKLYTEIQTAKEASST